MRATLSSVLFRDVDELEELVFEGIDAVPCDAGASADQGECVSDGTVAVEVSVSQPLPVCRLPNRMTVVPLLCCCFVTGRRCAVIVSTPRPVKRHAVLTPTSPNRPI